MDAFSPLILIVLSLIWIELRQIRFIQHDLLRDSLKKAREIQSQQEAA